MSKPNPFRYFRTSREVIRLAVMMYVRFPLSLRNVENFCTNAGIVRENRVETQLAAA